MRAVEVLRFAFSALVGSKLRSGLSLLGVGIGVTAVVLLTALGEGARRYVSREFETLGTNLAAEPAVTLCYQRPRNLPHWPYNLFTMLHGKERSAVITELDNIRQRLSIDSNYDVLFSTRCFKQRGARYF